MEKGRENKPHIGIFGRRNVGKSSLINALTGQDVAIVSEHPGTTTDPVKKSVEIFGIGPAIIIDTAGIDDSGDLGGKRVEKSLQAMKLIDMAIVVLNDNVVDPFDEKIMDQLYDSGVPWLFVHNKCDLVQLDTKFRKNLEEKYKVPVIAFSSADLTGFDELVSALRTVMPETAYLNQSLMGDLVSHGDVVLLITPIDTEAPEGRLILPQVQAIRDLLDHNCVAVVLKENQVEAYLKKTSIRPQLAVCDTSVILSADKTVPHDIPLTGFSILLARFKGEFDHYLKGTPSLDRLSNGDRVLILESCTHHTTCDDIGRVKLPRWISAYTGKKLDYDVVTGLNHLSRPVADYSIVIQCGGCMITRKQLVNRLRPAIKAGVPVTNYGMAIAFMQGVYERAVLPFINEK